MCSSQSARKKDEFICKVAYKVILVDKLYNCNLMMDHRKIADHIISLNIDSDLSAGRISVVDRISRFPQKKALVFASKYCHFHQPDKFPIWDKFTAIGLGDLMGKNYLKKRNYSQFKSDIDFLISKIGSQLSYKILDEYLWLYGQKIKNYKNSSAEIKELSKRFPHLFSQL